MVRIDDNPYRILGVFTNASLKEITANKAKIARYANVGESVSFEADKDDMLPPVVRTEETVDKAFSNLTLPEEKLKHAFFWFTEGNDETWSSLMNHAVMAFIQEDDATAVNRIMSVIHNGDMRKDFVVSVCGDTFQISENVLTRMFMDALLEREGPIIVYRLIKENDAVEADVSYLRERIMEAPVNRIKSEIDKAKKVDPKDNEGSYAAGVALMNDTKADLELLKELRVEGDSMYQMQVDSLANQILQCAINYYNGDPKTQYLRVENSEKLLNYATSIAEGAALKERCRQNMEMLIDNKKHFAISSQHKSIFALLEKYDAQPRTIDEAIQLIKDCTPFLEEIKKIFGDNDPMYLSYSTLVAKKALVSMMKEGTNAYKKDDSGQRNVPRIKEALKAQWRGTLYLEQMDLERAFADTNLKNYKKGLIDMTKIYQGFDPNEPNRLFGELIQIKEERPSNQSDVPQNEPLTEEGEEDQRYRKVMIIGIVVAVVVGTLLSMVLF